MESFSPFGGSPLRSHLPFTTNPMGSPLPFTTNAMASLQNNTDMMAVFQTLFNNSATTRIADGVSAMAMQLNQHQSATATTTSSKVDAHKKAGKPYPHATDEYGVPVNFGLPNSRLFTINGCKATPKQCQNSDHFAMEKIRYV